MKINEDVEMIVNTFRNRVPIDIEIGQTNLDKEPEHENKEIEISFEYNDEYKKMKNNNNNTDKKSWIVRFIGFTDD